MDTTTLALHPEQAIDQQDILPSFAASEVQKRNDVDAHPRGRASGKPARVQSDRDHAHKSVAHYNHTSERDKSRSPLKDEHLYSLQLWPW
ncbi:hypothetical protein NDU88_011744 [Pleurodeles waltl]|uniref:Uncharacterized protein n=1 Tax=Pleurodeles waltl TaxID=8319 RepID=A0AAV7Q5L9_PLEWA|nr:hypothetical protein NDU88_011744 [Pleurodeles waltl]